MHFNTLTKVRHPHLATQQESLPHQNPSPSWNHSPHLMQKSARRRRVFYPLLFHKLIPFAASDKPLFILNLSIPPTGSSRWIYQLIQLVAPASHGIPTPLIQSWGKLAMYVCVRACVCSACVCVRARKGESDQDITSTPKPLSALRWAKLPSRGVEKL